jgi:hypothetical protein
MAALGAPDLFAEIFAPADEVAAGLGALAQSAPLWGTRLEWTELVTALQSFEGRWGGVARLAGWSVVQLYGLDPVAPRNRLSRMGAGFLASLPGRQVLAVDHGAGERAVILPRKTSRQSVLKYFFGSRAHVAHSDAPIEHELKQDRYSLGNTTVAGDPAANGALVMAE